MANRYWVGGTANWDGTAGTKWAASSGGAGGASVPTSADDVFFDGLSTGTCTISAGNTGAKSINCTGFTGTIAGVADLTVSGSITLAAGMTFTYTGPVTINATATLTTAGKLFGNLIINAPGGTVTLGDAFTATTLVSPPRTITLTQGTFDAANFNVTTGKFSSSNSNTRTLTMGSGTWTITDRDVSWDCGTSTNLTLNANTSTISMTSTSTSFKYFYGGNKTYYNLNQGGAGPLVIYQSNTFNDLTNSVTTADTEIYFSGGTTSTFTNFTYSNTAPFSTIFSSFSSGTYTLSKSSGTVNVSRLLIRDSIATGGATWNATDSVDLGDNTGWNITASAGRYWVGGTAVWNDTAGTKWATSSGGAGGATVPGRVDPAYFNAASGANTVTMTSSFGSYLNCAGIICTGFTGTLTGTATIYFFGNLTLSAGMTYTHSGSLYLYSTCTITSAGKTLPSVYFSKIGSPGFPLNQTCTLADACTLSTTSTFTFTTGTLDLNGNTLSAGIFSSVTSNTRTIAFGSSNIALTSAVAGTTVLNMSSGSGFSFTGTGGFTRNMVATATVVFGTSGGLTSNAPNLTVNAGSAALTITNNSYFKNVNFTGYSGTATGSYYASGDITLSSGGTYTSLNPTFFVSATLTSVGKTLGNTTINGTGITVTLGDAATLATTGTFTLTRGTLNLNGNTLSTGIFSSSTLTARAIAFGSANIALTGASGSSQTVLSMSDLTNFTYTGTGGFTRNMVASATVDCGSVSGATTSNAPNLTVNAGSAALTMLGWFKNVNFTGYSGTASATYIATGDLTLSSGGTYTSLAPTFLGSATITSVGKTLGNTTINGGGITVTLGDAFDNGFNTFTLTQGTFNAANFNVTLGSFSSSNTNTRTLTMGSGTWTIQMNAAAWNTATTTNLTLNANTSTINMTASAGKAFDGGGRTYYNLNQGGAGVLVISGSNTFNNITNTTQPATVRFTSGTTQTVSNFGLSGTAGNLITIDSTSAGSQATLSKSSGQVNVDYLSIQDSNAAGGAAWYAGANSTNVSNNTGWIFTAAPTSGGSFFMFLS